MLILSDSFTRLYETVIKEPTIKVWLVDDYNCMYIQPNQKRYTEGIEYINRVYGWLSQGEYEHLRVVNVFQRYDMNTIKVCKREDTYSCLIESMEK